MHRPVRDATSCVAMRCYGGLGRSLPPAGWRSRVVRCAPRAWQMWCARSSVSAVDLFHRLHYLGYYVIHVWTGAGCPTTEYYMRQGGQKDPDKYKTCKMQPGRFLHWVDCSPIPIFDTIANVDRFLNECRYGRFFLKRTVEVYEQRKAMREGRSAPNATHGSEPPSRTVRTISSLKPTHGRPKY
jgi:hypothetical protein